MGQKQCIPKPFAAHPIEQPARVPLKGRLPIGRQFSNLTATCDTDLIIRKLLAHQQEEK